MEEVISLRFKYTEEEYVAALRFYLMHSPDSWIRFAVSSFFIAAGLYLGWLLDMDLGVLLPFALIGLFWLLFWILVLAVFPHQAFRREPKFQDEYFLQFSEDGIHFKTAQIDALVQWSLYTKVLENDRFYILVYGKNMLSVTPKRAFTSADQEAAFNRLLKQKFPVSFDSKHLKSSAVKELEKPYVPPTEPPDWR